MKTLIFKVLYSLKWCPIFIGSVHNFGKSDDDKIWWKKCFFPLDAYMVSCPTWSKNLGRTLINIHQSLLLDKKFPSMTTRASSDIIDQIKAEQSWDEPCSTHGIFAYGRGAGRQALCRGVGTKRPICKYTMCTKMFFWALLCFNPIDDVRRSSSCHAWKLVVYFGSQVLPPKSYDFHSGNC